MKSLQSAGIAFVLLLSACSTPDSNVPTQGSSISEFSANETATPVTLVADLVPSTTYIDQNLHFAFDYPAEWTINALPDVPGATITIHSWDPDQLSGDRPQSEGIPEGGEKLDITPLTNFDLNYEQALPWFRDQNTYKSFIEEQVTLPGGSPGILFLFDKTEDVGVRCLLTEVNGTAILACGLAWDFQLFEPIAFSIRPSE